MIPVSGGVDEIEKLFEKLKPVGHVVVLPATIENYVIFNVINQLDDFFGSASTNTTLN